MDANAVLDNIIYARAYTYEHQYNLLLALAAKMSEEPFRLLIMDFVIALFRVDFGGRGELAERQRKSVIRITTGSQALDELLGEIETLHITEAFGEFSTERHCSLTPPFTQITLRSSTLPRPSPASLTLAMDSLSHAFDIVILGASLLHHRWREVNRTTGGDPGTLAGTDQQQWRTKEIRGRRPFRGGRPPRNLSPRGKWGSA